MDTGNGDAMDIQDDSFFLNLPTELIDLTLSFLSPRDLDALACTCRFLNGRACSDLIWQPLVQENVPGCRLRSASPCSSFRDLYHAHDPHWFVSKYRIWFGDQPFFGRIMITYYNPLRGSIEGYRLVAERASETVHIWEHDDTVFISSFEPRVQLHMDIPVLRLDARDSDMDESARPGRISRRFDSETPMPLSDRHNRVAMSTFLLTRPVEQRPNMSLWPPVTIPASQRVRNLSGNNFVGHGHKPQTRMEISDQAFRIRQWMHTIPGYRGTALNLEPTQVNTYATLDPALYTPTADRPFRGIWVGDYSAHGCEFLLILQPDLDESFDESLIRRREHESHEQFLARKREARIYRGRIEAIKLTGDPNIPRGEYTWYAADIGDGGFLRIADEEPFEGARVVQCLGHIANQNFRDDTFVNTQLFIISPDRFAQHWVALGHISYYERVRIDDFIVPR